jgi:threonylcarbamoyladenosine tRNA methylthiotransferase MtaB
MKRRHLYRDVINFVDEARRRRKDIVFGGDFIAGFPTEDINAHNKSKQLIKEANISYVHVFPYSKRDKTAASKMPEVLSADIKKRAKDLRNLAEEQHEAFLQRQIGTVQNVLIEKNSIGHASNFSKVKLKDDVKPSSIISTRIVDINSEGLVGSVFN